MTKPKLNALPLGGHNFAIAIPCNACSKQDLSYKCIECNDTGYSFNRYGQILYEWIKEFSK